MRIRPILNLVVAAICMMACTAMAADPSGAVGSDDAYASAKSAQIEIMRVRLGGKPSVNGTAGLIEAEDLLRRFKSAPAGQKSSLRSQIDAAVARLELELIGR